DAADVPAEVAAVEARVERLRMRGPRTLQPARILLRELDARRAGGEEPGGQRRDGRQRGLRSCLLPLQIPPVTAQTALFALDLDAAVDGGHQQIAREAPRVVAAPLEVAQLRRRSPFGRLVSGDDHAAARIASDLPPAGNGVRN